MKKTTFGISLLIIGLIFLSACQPIGRQGDGNTQIANPASEYCNAQGGTLEIVTAAGGSQSGICTLKDGTKCEEWAYMRGECPAKACTEEAKLCPDGSAVGRTGPNCEFAACPESLILCTPDQKECADGTFIGRDASKVCEFKECSSGEKQGAVIRNYAANDRTTCAATDFICPENTEQFFDDSGCGCQASPRTYIGESPEKCQVIRYMCIKGSKPFTDNFGCGCEFDWSQETNSEEVKYISKNTEECSTMGVWQCDDGYSLFSDDTGCGCKPKEEGKLQAIDCTDPRPTACTKEYMPVCGQKDNGIRCIRAPCPSTDSVTYGNKCEACADEKVYSYTVGACSGDTTGSEGNIQTSAPAKTYCKPEQRGENKACTMDYNPVCGYDSSDNPLQTYGNVCGACADKTTQYWVAGECAQYS